MAKFRLFQTVYYSKVVDCIIEAKNEDDAIERARNEEFDYELEIDTQEPEIDEISFEVEPYEESEV